MDYQPDHPFSVASLQLGKVEKSDHYIKIVADTPSGKFNPNIDLFVLKNEKFNLYHTVGTHFACPGAQKYNHILNDNVLKEKDLVYLGMKGYAEYYRSRPQ
jgi:hypothetical protein